MPKAMIRLALIIILASCHPERNKKIAESQLRFDTTDASELFFQNVRKSDYHLEEKKDAGLNIFRHKALVESNLIIEPMLILSWRNDKAYFHLEGKGAEGEWLIILKGTVTDSIRFDGTDQRTNALLALRIYNMILDEGNVSLVKNNEQCPFFNNAKESDTFRIMFFDFLRLVELR